MLGKLLKYDLRSSKIMLLVYAISIVTATAWAIAYPLMDTEEFYFQSVASFFIAFAYFLALAAFFLPLILMVVTFYKKMISDQAYLTFTLPVPRYYHIISKMTTHAIWCLSSTVVAFVSLIIVAIGFVAKSDPSGGSSVPSVFDPSVIPIIIEAVILYFVIIFTAPLFTFASLAFGQVIMKKHKIIGAVIANYILNVIINIVYSVIAMIVSMVYSGGSDVFSKLESTQMTVMVLGIFTLVIILVSVGLFFFTNYCLTKKLNLE